MKGAGTRKRLVLWLILAGLLLASKVEKLTDGIWTVELGRCSLDYHTSVRTFALACPGMDYIRIWPLPVVKPWEEPERLPGPRSGEKMARFRTLKSFPSLSCT
jgi:hypothetical protein